MKIILTGTHFTTALAVAEELKKTKGVRLVYVGRKFTMEGDNTPSVESQVLPKQGVKFIPIITGRLQRSFTLFTIPSLLKLPIGLVQSLFIILSEKPDVIVSFGGYVSVPIIIIGWLFSIPILIHEQTLVSGLANRIGSFFANKIALSFDYPYSFSTNTILTGNPLRDEILHPKYELLDLEYKKLFNQAKKEKLPLILITGGNQGSHTINKFIEKILKDLTKLYFVIHQTGDSKFGDFERLSLLQNEHYLVKKWIDKEIGAVLSKIDLVISRAGANTLVELAFFGKPALVIPFEALSHDEQNKNAAFFENLGLARKLPQSKLSEETLLSSIKEMISGLTILNQKAKMAKRAVYVDAAKRLSLEILLLGKFQNNF